MHTDEIIIRLFCMGDDRLGAVKRHPQANLHPREVVTIGRVFARKGGSYRAFYRWLAANWAALFAGIPEQSRLFRQLCQWLGIPISSWLIPRRSAFLIRWGLR